MRIRATVLILALAVALAAAQAVSYCASSGTGTYTGELFNTAGGVRAAAMGGASIAVGGDNNSMHHNPAGLAEIKTGSLSSAHSSMPEGVSCSNLSVSLRTDQASFGISADYINTGAIQETTLAQPAGTGRAFLPYGLSVAVCAAKEFNPALNAGLGARYVSEDIDGSLAAGYGVDAGALLKINENVTAGLRAKNVLSTLAGGQMASEYGIGTAFKQYPFLLAADINMPSDNNMLVSIGAEYAYNEILFIRAGYNTRSEESAGGNFSAGVGFTAGGAAVDYAYVPYGDLGAVHRVGVAFKLGQEPEAKASAPSEETLSPAKLTEVNVPSVPEPAPKPGYKVKIYPPKLSMKPGDSIIFMAKVYDAEGRLVNVPGYYWESKGEMGAINPATGYFLANKPGKGTVTFISSAAKATVNVQVVKKASKKKAVSKKKKTTRSRRPYRMPRKR